MSNSLYRTWISQDAEDIQAAQRLRHLAFRSDGAGDDDLDTDAFDALCRHILVQDIATGQLVATLRLLPLDSGSDIGTSYSAQFYELTGLSSYKRPMIEVGRFCIAPEVTDPDVLRAAWGALAGLVEAEGIAMLFGCSSFQGTDARAYADAFAMLKERHLAPKRWLPRIKAPNVFRFAEKLRRKPDRKRALKTMPPLLRSYLSLGGWVSDHAVVDPEMDTLHVFTGLETRRIPARRARTLLAVAGA